MQKHLHIFFFLHPLWGQIFRWIYKKVHLGNSKLCNTYIHTHNLHLIQTICSCTKCVQNVQFCPFSGFITASSLITAFSEASLRRGGVITLKRKQMSSKCKQRRRRCWPSTPWGWPASTHFLRLLWTRLEMRGRFRSRHGRKILKTDDGLENPKHCHQHDHSSNRTAVDSLVYLIGLTIVEWNNLEIRII